MNGRDRVAVVLRTHAAVPTATANGPRSNTARSNTDRCDLEVAISQAAGVHDPDVYVQQDGRCRSRHP